MDLQSRLALYRTHLAEKRTAIAQLQLGILLVTIPLSVHAAVMLLGSSHITAGGFNIMAPLTVALGALAIAGGVLTAHGIRDYRRASLCIREIRAQLEAGRR